MNARIARKARLSYPVLFAVSVLSCALCGCAEYDAYRKCGSAGCPGDAQLTAEVRTLLAQHRELSAPNEVDVRTLDRVVYLSGQVATDLQRDIAESLARAAGARSVVDNISLAYTGR